MVTRQIEYDEIIDTVAEENKLADDNEAVEKEIMTEFDSDGSEVEWRVKVKKVNQRTKKQETCFFMSPDELPELFDRLKREFGPGHYRAFVLRNNQVYRNLGYDIAAPIPAAIGAPSQITDISNMISHQNEQIASMMSGNSPGTVQPDPMAQMTAMVGMMVQMKDFLKPATPPNNFKDFLEMLQVAKEIQGDAQTTGKTVMDVLGDLVNSPIAQEMADQFKHQRSLPAPQSRINQAVASEPAVNLEFSNEKQLQENPQSSGDNASSGANTPEILAFLDTQTIQQIKTQILVWVDRAKANSDPALYAELALDTFPVDFIQQFLGRSDIKETIIHLVPAAESQWGWFEELTQHIDFMLTDDQDAGDKLEEINQNMANVPFEPDTVKSTPLDPDGNSVGESRSKSDVGNNERISPSRKKKSRSKTSGGGAGKEPASKRRDGGNKKAS